MQLCTVQATICCQLVVASRHYISILSPLMNLRRCSLLVRKQETLAFYFHEHEKVGESSSVGTSLILNI